MTIKTLGALALAASFILAGSIGAYATQGQQGSLQDTAAQKPPSTGQQPPSYGLSEETTTVSGKVTNGQGSVLTVTDAQNVEHKITVTADTKLTKGGKEAKPTDLKINDSVTVQAKKSSDGTLTAISIDIAGE